MASRRLLQLDEAAPALLVQAAEARMMPLQGRERLQGLVDPAEIALRQWPRTAARPAGPELAASSASPAASASANFRSLKQRADPRDFGSSADAGDLASVESMKRP